MRFDLTGWAQQGTSCGQEELRNPGGRDMQKSIISAKPHPPSLVTTDSCWETENKVTLGISVTLEDRPHAQE